jgi:hypothetical protein
LSKKTESLQEFLSRGGKINVVPPKRPETKDSNVKSTVSNPVTILSYGDAENYYGQKTTRKRKVKKIDVTDLNMDVVPDDLKKILGLDGKKED